LRLFWADLLWGNLGEDSERQGDGRGEGGFIQDDPVVDVTIWRKRTRKEIDPKQLVKLAPMLSEIFEKAGIDDLPLWHFRETKS